MGNLALFSLEEFKAQIARVNPVSCKEIIDQKLCAGISLSSDISDKGGPWIRFAICGFYANYRCIS